MTHADLVERAKKWLYKTRGCGFVFTELVTTCCETPDAIGFLHTHSILVECKTSRSDFRQDHKKFFRENPYYGMGNARYYMTPPDLIKKEELPDKWGLIEVHQKLVRVIYDPMKSKWGDWPFNDEYSKKEEWKMMYSALRRVKLQGDLEKIYEKPYLEPK